MTTSVRPSGPDPSHLSAHSLAHLRALLVTQLRTQEAQATAPDAAARQLSGETAADGTAVRTPASRRPATDRTAGVPRASPRENLAFLVEWQLEHL